MAYPSPAVWAPRWTPLSIGVDVWFDCADLQRMRQDSLAINYADVDGDVSAFLSKGNNHNWALNLDGSAPILRESSGIFWLEFDGVDNCLDFIAAPAVTISLGMQYLGNTVGYILNGFVHELQGNASGVVGLVSGGQTFNIGFVQQYTGGPFNQTGIKDNNKHVVSIIIDTSTLLGTVWVDGVDSGADDFKLQKLNRIGKRFDDLGASQVNIYQLIISSQNHVSDRTSIESFIEDRMGV